jgi:adhesin HecA-like repeat protein
VRAGAIVQDGTAVTPGFPWTVADFAPGGRFSSEPGYITRTGNWNPYGAAPGIYYVDGNVTISASSVDLRGVTIVATGTVTVSGSDSRLSPARSDLPTVLAGGGDCHRAAINVSGSSVRWEGLLAAPNGLAQINGSKPRGGQVMAFAIQSLRQRHPVRVIGHPVTRDRTADAAPSPNRTS